MPAGDLVEQVAQQSALADARLPAQGDHAAPTGEHVGKEPVERLTLGTSSEELGPVRAILARRRPPCAKSPGKGP
jgi:hypothetical protein